MTIINWTKEQQKEHRNVWIKALRSGEYEQIIGITHSFDNNYCAMGLAIHLQNLVEISTTDGFCSYYGLKDVRGSYKTNRHYRSIIDDNDIRGLDFNQIADIIESEPEGLVE